jgi:anti-sigma B factor antagonist
MLIQVRTEKRVCVIEVSGRLVLDDGESSLRAEIGRQLEDGQRRFVLNLNGLSVIDSAGVGEIVASYQLAFDHGAVLKVALRSDGLVARVFAVSGLDRALEIFPEESEAIASYS